MLKNLQLALKFLWRECRYGEWLIVIIALLLAITVTTSIHFYTDRLMRGLDQQGAKFLGGNLVVSSATPFTKAWLDKAASLQLATAQVWAYPTVATVNNQMQLINVQAVSGNYPLLGEQAINPAPKTVWVEPRLLPLLHITMQSTLQIGAEAFAISQLLTPDINRMNTGWTIAPTVMMRLDDVAATKTVIPGSRVDYRLLLAGDNSHIAVFKNWVTPQLTAGQRLVDVTTQDFALKNVLQRTDNYLQLILLVCLLMSGVAIALSIQQFLRRHYAHVALWRCLGATSSQITQLFFWQLLIISLVTGALGIMISFIAQSLFANLFNTYLNFPLPAAGIKPVIMGFIASITLLFLFAYPVVSELPRTSPLFLWRNNIAKSSLRKLALLLISWVGIVFFIYAFMSFSNLAFVFIFMMLFSVSILYGLSWLLLKMLHRLLPFTEGALRRGISQLIQYPQSTSLQLIAFNLILTVLLILGLVRSDLLTYWRHSLPQLAPNYFAFNIAPTDLTHLTLFFKQHNISIEQTYPMVRGRIVSLNHQPIMNAVPASALSNNALHRELNLSWMWDYPSDNKIILGKSWDKQDHSEALISVEKKLAADLHLKLGDILTFQIGDQEVSASISNIRSVEWTSFHPNFFVIFTPGILDTFSATYITSFHLAANQTDVLNQLVQTFPNITILDVASLLTQMQILLGKITLALQYIFIVAFAAGLLIFITCLQASMDERRQTYTLLRVLGASKRYIRKSLIVEFGVLGLLILGTAMSMAYGAVWVLEYYIFNV